jgi:hypothetical protein
MASRSPISRAAFPVAQVSRKHCVAGAKRSPFGEGHGGSSSEWKESMADHRQWCAGVDWASESRHVFLMNEDGGIRSTPPSGGGSRWKVSDPSQRDIPTVPYRRPVKAVYIRRLVRFVDAVEEARDAKA